MGISRRKDNTLLTCDICGTFRIEHSATWDENRTASQRAGWRLSKGRSHQWQAFCPDCDAASGYSPEDVLGSNLGHYPARV